ncbi:MAG: hypothetical protein HS128_08530 [Ideonella sp.]|nr:hypothetical protein [Ideonella sp.]MCC7457867.1 hypothetical protein [Nitrospira sp.]
MATLRSPAPPAGQPAPHGELEAALQRLEQQLDQLQAALGTREGPEIQQQAVALQHALARLVDHGTQAARRGDALPPRWRLARTGAQVAAQREALARAGAALDRAIGVLVPGADCAVYSARGVPGHVRSAASISA